MQYFIYSRNRNNDYKLIYAPSPDYCPSEVRLQFIKQARGVINIESYPGTLETPRWFISRIDGCVLFGVGCLNRVLSDTNNTDYTGTPVRGFFGIVINEKVEQKGVPYDISFFKDLYESQIIPVWENARDEFKFIGVEANIDETKYEFIERGVSGSGLNTSERQTFILPEATDTAAMIAEVLSTSEDTSFVSNLDAQEHATASEINFYNAAVNGVTEKIIKQRVLKAKEGVGDDGVGGDGGEIILEPPKKAFSPKAILQSILRLWKWVCNRVGAIISKMISKNSTLGDKSKNKR